MSDKVHGNKGRKLSEETKRKMSKAWKNRESVSDKTKRKMSERMKGKNNPMYGKHHSEEAKRKISEGNKWRIFSEETKRKMSDAHKARKKSRI